MEEVQRNDTGDPASSMLTVYGLKEKTPIHTRAILGFFLRRGFLFLFSANTARLYCTDILAVFKTQEVGYKGGLMVMFYAPVTSLGFLMIVWL